MGNDLQPGPPRVQIQTQAGCNGRCIFCPNEEVLQSDLPMGKMPQELFQKIIDELAETVPNRVMLYLQNEPLNDSRLPEFVWYLADRIPDTTSLVVTNGTNLTEEIGEKLIDAGLKRLKVSLQSLDNESNQELMGYKADKVINNVIAFKRLIREKRSKLDLRISMVITSRNNNDIAQARKFWKKHDIRLVTSALENRGGNVTNAESMCDTGMRVREDCIRPSREMCVLYNGQVILCCVDWFRTIFAGDLSKQSVREVWNSAEFKRIRNSLQEGNTAEMPRICVGCAESAKPNKHRRGLWSIMSLFKTAK